MKRTRKPWLDALLLVMLLSLCFFPVHAKADIIETFAGGSTEGSDARAVSVNGPNGVVVDAAGAVFVAETNLHRVRRIDPDGRTSIVAGRNGFQGFQGDGGPAVEAALAFPRGLALDGAGNLYIADSGNHRIRKVNAATGNISTVAGGGQEGWYREGLATNVAYANPVAVAVDAIGNIFIADSGYNRIRKVDTNGYSSSVAGNGSYGFDGNSVPAATTRLARPAGIAVDAAGNLYIADTENRRVRKLDGSGLLVTVAGSGVYGYNGDGVPATQAAISYPVGIALAAGGGFYFADQQNNRIRKVDASGIIATVAGIGAPGFSGDGIPAASATLTTPLGVAVAAEAVFIADTGNHRIRRVAAETIDTLAGNGFASFSGDGGDAWAAELNAPYGLAVRNGETFIADSSNNRIRKIDASGVITTVAGGGTPADGLGDGLAALEAALVQPQGVAFDGTGNLLIADFGNHRIRKVDASGAMTTVAGGGLPADGLGDGLPAAEAALSFPTGLSAFGGELFIADQGNHRIRKVDASGTITTVAGGGAPADGVGDGLPATEAGLSSPFAVANDPLGNLYIADTYHSRIRAVDVSGFIRTVAGNGTYGYAPDNAVSATSATLTSPRGIAFDSAGDLYIVDGDIRRVRRVKLAGDLMETIAGTGPWGASGDGGAAFAAVLNFPQSIAIDANDDLYVSETSGNRVRWINRKPHADFSHAPTRGYRGLTVAFANRTVTASGTSWQWNFGDGTSDTAENASHAYPAKGIYTVSLAAAGPSGLPEDASSRTFPDAVCVGYIFSAGSDTAGTAPFTRVYSRSGSLHARVWATLPDVNYDNLRNATVRVVDVRGRSASANLTHQGNGVFTGSVPLSSLRAGAATATFTVTDRDRPAKTFTATEAIALQ